MHITKVSKVFIGQKMECCEIAKSLYGSPGDTELEEGIEHEEEKDDDTQIVLKYSYIYRPIESQRNFTTIAGKVKNSGVSGPVRARARGSGRYFVLWNSGDRG